MKETKTLHVDGTDYPTTLTDKYERRPKWERRNPKRTRAVIPGTIVELRIELGQNVQRGQPLLVLEAMKMQNEVLAAASGIVESIHVETGQVVAKNDLLVELS